MKGLVGREFNSEEELNSEKGIRINVINYLKFFFININI